MRSSSRGVILPTRSCCSCRGSSPRPSSSPGVSSSRSSPPGRPATARVAGLRSAGVAHRRQRDAACRRDAERGAAGREDRLLDRLDRLHRLGRRRAAVRTVSGAGPGVLPLRAPLPRRAPRARAGVPGRQLRLARHAARVGERRAAGRPPAERDAAPSRDRDRRGHGARTAASGDSRRADGLCDYVRRADARAGDCVRPRRT